MIKGIKDILVLYIAFGIVLGFILLELISYEAFWKFICWCMGILLITLLCCIYFDFIKSIFAVLCWVGFVCLIVFLLVKAVVFLWANHTRIPRFIQNMPLRIKNWLVVQYKKSDSKVFFILGLIACVFYIIAIIFMKRPNPGMF